MNREARPVSAANKQQPVPIAERVQIFLTREGGIYLIVWLFVTSGALLRNINMLVLMAAIMIAPLLIGWRLNLAMLRKLRANRRVQKIAFAQEAFDVNWELHNDRAKLATWQLVIQDQGRRIFDDELKSRHQVVQLLFRLIRPQETRYQSYRANISQRGEYRFGPAKLTTRFPFGLMKATLEVETQDIVYVAPKLGALSASWDRRLLSYAAGDNSIKRKRALVDDEFFALRTWRSGDSIKQIHWRSTAKFGVPMVKQFDTRTDKDVVLILDLYEELTTHLAESGQDQSAIELLLSFGATLFSRLENHVSGLITVAICGSDNCVHSDQNYSNIAFEVFRDLALAREGRHPLTVKTVLDIGRRASEGTPIYVFSTRPFTDALLEQLEPEELIRYRSLQNMVRWIEYSSDEFQEMFNLVPPDHRELNAVGKLST